MLRKKFNDGPDPRVVTNAEAAGAYQSEAATFVDVREPEEWVAGHIPGAIHIPLGDLSRRADEIPTDGRIVTVCRVGQRSLTAVDILEAKGRKDVKSMAGGMVEWAQNGRPIK